MEFFLIKCKVIIYKTLLTHIAARSTLFPIAYKDIAISYVCIHSVFSLTTGTKPPPKRFLHIVRSRASSLK